jgi:hypothetical protein
VVNGFIVAITVVDGGTGYSTSPAVAISGGGGTGATATATVLNGAVDKIIVGNAGNGYTNAPKIEIAAPPIPTQPFGNGLIAYYPFNGNADDQSGNAYNATVVGAKLVLDRFSATNSAYRFIQASDHLVVPVDFKNSQKITVSGWVKFDTQNKGQSFFNLIGPFHGINLSYDPNGAFQFFVGGNAGSAYALYYATPPTNTWHLYTGTYNGQTAKLFIDGVLVASQNFTGDILYTDTWPSWIGNYSPDPSMPLQGSIDDMRFYNLALSNQEVENLYNYEAPQQPSITIKVKTIQVTMHVRPSKTYQLEASLDLKTWNKLGDAFVASTSESVQEFNTIEVGRYFRIQEVP